MSLFESVLLGIVQGLTEFLPISSSGHLVLGESLLKVKFDDISFEVFLHFGTLFSVVIFFRHRIWSMLKALWLKARSISGSSVSSYNSENWRLFWQIIVGSIPAGVIGLLFENILEKSFSSVIFVSVMLLVTGVVLFSTQFFKEKKENLTFGNTFIIGLAQAIAILPGISRSGVTISTGIFAGVKRSKVAEFSFLLSLPAVLGASLLKLKDVLGHTSLRLELRIYVIGAVTAFVVGYLSIKFLLNVIKKGKFQYFGYYCFAVGLLFLIFAR